MKAERFHDNFAVLFTFEAVFVKLLYLRNNSHFEIKDSRMGIV